MYTEANAMGVRIKADWEDMLFHERTFPWISGRFVVYTYNNTIMNDPLTLIIVHDVGVANAKPTYSNVEKTILHGKEGAKAIPTYVNDFYKHTKER